MIHLRYLLLMTALALASKADAQCRGGNCSAPTFSQAAPVFVPAAASPARGPLASGVVPQPQLADEVLVLSRRITKLADEVRAMRHERSASPRRSASPGKAKATIEPCIDVCRCGRCGERCPCREGAGRCGSGCACVLSEWLKETQDEMKRRFKERTGRDLGTPEEEAGRKLPTGVDASKLSAEPRFTLDGKEITPAKGARLIEGDEARVPDDAGKVRVVIAGGTDTQRRQVLDDLAKAPPAISDRFLTHAYPADSPLVRDRGWVATGSPSITVYTPGKPGAWRNRDGTYRGAEALYAAIEAVSKYDPVKDKDLWGGGTIDLAALKKQLEKVPPGAWLVGAAGAAGLLLAGKRKEEK